MNLPTPYTIGLRKALQAATDAHGNSTVSYADPIYYAVHSVAPTTSTEPFESGRDVVTTGLTVLAPVETPVGAYDRVLVDNKEYTVEGEINDWSKGPFEWLSGLSFNLKRVEG